MVLRSSCVRYISVPCDKAHARKISKSNDTPWSLCLLRKAHMPHFTAVDVSRVAARSTAVHISLLAAAVLPSICRYWLPEYCRECAVTHTDILPITCCHRMLHCWRIYALTVYHNAVAIVPTWCSRAVRMLLYADVETSFLVARVLFHGVFLLPEYRHFQNS